MKEAIIALIGVVVGGAVTFFFSLRRAVWIENRQRKKERQGRIDAFLSAIKDAVSVIGKNFELIEQKGELREIPLLHQADAWRSIINLGRMDFLGDDTVGGLREISFVLERADGYVRGITEAERELVNPGTAARSKAVARKNTLRDKLDRIYHDNAILPRLREVKRKLEEERAEQG